MMSIIEPNYQPDPPSNQQWEPDDYPSIFNPEDWNVIPLTAQESTVFWSLTRSVAEAIENPSSRTHEALINSHALMRVHYVRWTEGFEI